MHATFSTLLVFLYLIILTISQHLCSLWNSSLCNFFLFQVTQYIKRDQVSKFQKHVFFYFNIVVVASVTVAARYEAWTVFGRSDAGIVGSNPIQGVDVWCVYAFILRLCCPVFRQRPCYGLITRPRSSTVCEKWLRNWIRGQCPEWAERAIEKKTEVVAYDVERLNILNWMVSCI
jgi:hypothetical protein